MIHNDINARRFEEGHDIHNTQAPWGDERESLFHMVQADGVGQEFIDGPRRLDYTKTALHDNGRSTKASKYPEHVTSCRGSPMGVPKAWTELTIMNLWAGACAEGTFQENFDSWELYEVVCDKKCRNHWDNTSIDIAYELEAPVRVKGPRPCFLRDYREWSHKPGSRIHSNIGYFNNRSKSKTIESTWTESEKAEMKMEGIDIPEKHEVLLRGKALGEFPKLVNGDDFAAVWQPKHTKRYYDLVAHCGLLLNPSKQGISQTSIMFSEKLLNFQVSKCYSQNGRLKGARLMCSPVDRIVLSAITLAKADRDRTGSYKGTKLQSIASVVNTTVGTFRGFRRKAVLRSIFLFNQLELQRARKANIPLNWPVPLGGAGFMNEPWNASVLHRKAAAVILTLDSHQAMQELSKLNAAWNAAIPSRSQRSAANLQRRVMDFSIKATSAATISQIDAMTEPDDERWGRFRQVLRDMNRIDTDAAAEGNQSMSQKLMFEKILDDAIDAMKHHAEVIDRGATVKTAQRYIDNHVPVLVSRDFTLSRLAKSKELGLDSVSKRQKKRLIELTNRWKSVKPITSGKIQDLLGRLDNVPSIRSIATISMIEAIARTTSPRDAF
uniref:RdRp n=1 Tax=viral metagenome TaxID=1070528 RepID=A0A2V0RGU7_9ZZZZ